MKEAILVSACLLGEPCRYDGKSKPSESVIKLHERYNLIPICPEVMGGLSTPRAPAEITPFGIKAAQGTDVTGAFYLGAKKSLTLAKRLNIRYAILKENSPSCGANWRYDGTFSRTLIPKSGLTAALFKKNDIIVFSENDLEALMECL